MKTPASLPSLVLGAALGVPLVGSLAACEGGSRCDPDTPNVICTIAGSGVQDFGGDGGHGLDLVGKKLYVTDSYNNRVRALTLP